MVRLDKLLCELNLGSRSQVKKLIRMGQVTVDGRLITCPEEKVEETALLAAAGREYRYKRFVYYMLHKPAGVVSATSDQREKTVLELLGEVSAKGMFPVGRLDKDTEGLLLLTNDGELAHCLLAPGRHVEKTYLVKGLIPLGPEQILRLEKGVDIGDDTPTRPARVEEQDGNTYLVTVTEGRYHQIKRMFEAVGNEVVYLKRLRMGSLVLDESLPKGEYRELTAEEEEKLKAYRRKPG